MGQRKQTVISTVATHLGPTGIQRYSVTKTRGTSILWGMNDLSAGEATDVVISLEAASLQNRIAKVETRAASALVR